jgi:hypothetical protein
VTGDVSLSLLTRAAAPAIAFIAIGLAWLSWDRPIKAIPATLLSIGLALLTLMLLIVVAYTIASGASLQDSVFVLMGLPLLVYAASLVIMVRRSNISKPKAVAWGMIGLVPLYFVSGVVLIYSACSFGTGGC